MIDPLNITGAVIMCMALIALVFILFCFVYIVKTLFEMLFITPKSQNKLTQDEEKIAKAIFSLIESDKFSSDLWKYNILNVSSRGRTISFKSLKLKKEFKVHVYEELYYDGKKTKSSSIGKMPLF